MTDPTLNYYAPPGAPSIPVEADLPSDAPAFGAPMGIRFGARLIDGIIAFVLGTGVSVMAVALGPQHVPTGTSIAVQFATGFFAPIVGGAVAACVGGATLGKLACGLVVVDQSGAPCSFVAGLKREALFVVDSFFFGVVAYTFMSRSPRQQRLGDRWAKTMVVDRSAYPALATRNTALGIMLGLAAYAAMEVASVVAGFLV